MGHYYFNHLWEETSPTDPQVLWCVVWVRTCSGYNAHIGQRQEHGWGQPATLTFEGFEFTPQDALMAWNEIRKQVPERLQ